MGALREGNRVWLRLSAIAVSRSFGCSTMDPALDSEGRGVRHTNCTDNAEYDVHYACDGGSRNGSVVQHGL
jgi:hypothetical protein